MKFYGALLALSSLYSASAFVGQAPAFSRSGTALASTRAQGTDASTSTGMDAYTQSLQQMQQGQRQQPQTMSRSSSSTTPGRAASASRSRSGEAGAKKAFDVSAPVTVQGGSLKTWSLKSTAIEQVQVVLNTEGRPLDADIDLWHGPDNTPQKMRVYVEDGAKRPFSAVVQTPRGPNTIAIRNIGQMEFPLSAFVLPNPDVNVDAVAYPNNHNEAPKTIQGGALKTYPFDPRVQSVQIMLKTDGRPLNARIELLQGPNNNKQVMEVYIEDGEDRPFFAVIETPGSGNVVRIVNTATVEFPLSASVLPYEVSDYGSEDDIVIGGDAGSFSRDLQW